MPRRKILIFFITNIILVSFLLHSFWPLLCLLVETGESDAISRAEIPAPNSTRIGELPRVVPRIIHQTYITCDIAPLLNGTCETKEVPSVWSVSKGSCRDLHEGDYEFMFWRDWNSRDFIRDEYPWFLETWDSYSFPIQRADAIRYFALEHYGGVYIDLDNGCQRRLDPLLAYPAWVRRSHPTGIGNDVIGVIPHHPFIQRAIRDLQDYNKSWFMPYITIMASTGPLFFSLLWHHYNADQGYAVRPEEKVRILFGEEYMGNGWSFFSHHMGNSWHMWDAKAIFWMSSHWIEVTILMTALCLFILFIFWYLWNNISRIAGWRRRNGFAFNYARLPKWRRAQKTELNEV